MSPPVPPAKKKMLILRGNDSPAGTYPDEYGTKIAWPNGALHVWAASEYAKRNGYEPIVLDISGKPQSETSPQATEALKRFLDDQSIKAFYGFSGGGLNLRYILRALAKNNPEELGRIDLVVVLGSPEQPQSEYEPSKYINNSELTKKKIDPAKWAHWELIYKDYAPQSALPAYVPEDTPRHMFLPDWLLNQWEMKDSAVGSPMRAHHSVGFRRRGT
jgi:hypothetical protein